MHAGAAVNWEAVVHAASGTNFGGARMECQGEAVGRIMGVGAGRANFVIGDELQDVRGTQFGNSAAEIEWKMVSLKTFGSAEGARTSGSRDMGRGRVTRRFGFGVGRTVVNMFDPHIHRGIVAIEESRVGSKPLLQLVYKSG